MQRERIERRGGGIADRRYEVKEGSRKETKAKQTGKLKKFYIVLICREFYSRDFYSVKVTPSSMYIICI